MIERSRVTILYPARTGVRFDFGYYVPSHLPLAVGTSLRHAAIIGCDASRPINTDTPYACICTVEFEAPEAMDGFRHFFTSGHPETARILHDEPNYTDITPLFVAGLARGDVAPRPAPETIGYRMQLVFPAPAASRFDHKAFAELAPLRQLELDIPGIHTELDSMTAGLMPDSAPEIHCIWTGWVPDRGALDALATRWSGSSGANIRTRLSQVTNAPPQAVFAEVLTLDMARARSVARRGQSMRSDT